jgi:hypothetical protein
MGTRLDGWWMRDVEAVFAGIVVPMASTALAVASKSAVKSLKVKLSRSEPTRFRSSGTIQRGSSNVRGRQTLGV